MELAEPTCQKRFRRTYLHDIVIYSLVSGQHGYTPSDHVAQIIPKVTVMQLSSTQLVEQDNWPSYYTSVNADNAVIPIVPAPKLPVRDDTSMTQRTTQSH